MNRIIEREIVVFDNDTELYITSIPINDVTLEFMIKLLGINVEIDPLAFNSYELSAESLKVLSELNKSLENFDIKKFSYYYEPTELQSYKRI